MIERQTARERVRWWAGETGPGVILWLVIIYIENLNFKKDSI